MRGVDLIDDCRCRGAKDFTGAWIDFGKHYVPDGEPVLKYFKGGINDRDQSLWIFSFC
jgi:hypothetical protein|tara:strand:- start:796 stop:969 length:174 start_codon:yes stop_codon:yes gene_type:complete